MKKRGAFFIAAAGILAAGIAAALNLTACKYDREIRELFDRFTIAADADTTIGVTGQEFTLSVRVTGSMSRIRPDISGLTFTWTRLVETDDETEGRQEDMGLTGSSETLSFAEPGEYIVQVTAQDRDGNTATSGAVFHVYDPAGTHLVGDIDASGAVTEADADLLEGYLGGTVVFDQARAQRADVNLDNTIDAADLALVQGAAGAAAPTYVGADSAGTGGSVFVIHPALTDPAASVSLRFETTTAGTYTAGCVEEMAGRTPAAGDIMFHRSAPGYLVFAIPPKYACLTAAETVSVIMTVDGTDITLKTGFQIQPLPEVTGVPGSLVLESLDTIDAGMQTLEDGIGDYVDEIGGDSTGTAALAGMVDTARDMYGDSSSQFARAFNQLDYQTKLAWERMARAQGMDDLVSELKEEQVSLRDHIEALRAQRARAAIVNPQTLLNLICGFNKVIDLSSKIADINDKIAGYLEYVDWWPLNRAPVVGPAVTFLSGVSEVISAATDIIAKIGAYVPKLADKIKVAVTNAAMILGDSTEVTAGIVVQIAKGLCDNGAGNLVDKVMGDLKTFLTNRIGSKVPVANKYFKAARYKVEKMGWAVKKLYQAVGKIAGAVIDASGLKGYLSDLADAFCSAFGNAVDPQIPVSSDYIEASCPALSGKTWTCTESCIGTVSFDAEKTDCGKTRTGSASATCSAEQKVCKCDDSGVTFTVIPGDWTDWGDCGEATACHSIKMDEDINDGETIEAVYGDSGCKMQVHCP